MEGEGGGMVAVVQRLRDAGLAVTLMSRSGASGKCKLDDVPAQLAHAKSSVDTSTKPLMSHTGAQICDDTYSSSYQLAHCNIQPSSPPIMTPEFPLQRPQRSPTQGNFQVGSGGNDGRSSRNAINLSPRNGFMIPNRDIQPSRGTDAFVESLRKYPSVATERSASSDLVQQLLVCTQAKNSSKSACQSKRIKNQNKKTTEFPSDVNSDIHKCVQTYTRIQRDVIKNASTTNRTTLRDTRYKTNRVNGTYDYLGSTSPRPFNGDAEVRYLDEVARRLRDVLRPSCDHRNQVCPRMQTRYSHHRRQHHGGAVGQNLSLDSNETQVQASVPMVSIAVPNTSSFQDVPAIAGHSSKQCNGRCCYCHEPLPCHCSRRSLSDSSIRETYTKNLEHQVYDWLRDIPVYVNEKPEEQNTRQYLIQGLIDRLNMLPRDEFYEENAKNEILECVNKLPMWQPMSKRDQEVFKAQIINNLINKIKNILCDSDYEKGILNMIDNISLASLDSSGNLVDKQDLKDNLHYKLNCIVSNPPLSDKLKAEIMATLKEFPIKIKGDKTKYISKLGDKFVHKLKHLSKDSMEDRETLKEYVKHISNWVEDIPELYNKNTESIGHREKLSTDLAKKLLAQHANGVNGTISREKARNEIIKWLEDNTESRLGTKSIITLCDKLLHELNEAAVLKSVNENDFFDPVLDWLEDIPEIKGTMFENCHEAEILSNLLSNLHSQSKSDDKLIKEIRKWLDHSFEIKNVHLDPRTQIGLAKTLLYKINSSINDHKHKKDNTPTIDRSNKDLGSKENTKNAEKSFHPQELPSQQKKQTNNFKLKDNLPEQRKHWNRSYNDSDPIAEKIIRILNDTVKNIDGKSRNEIKSKILNAISKNFDRLKLGDNIVFLSEITDIIEKRTQFSKREANNIAKVILRAVQSIPQDIIKLNASQDSDVKIGIKEEISHILDGADKKVENRSDVETKLSNVLAEQMMRCESDAKIKDNLMTILINGNLSDDESERIATDLIEKCKMLSLSYNYSPQFSENTGIISKADDTHVDIVFNEIKKTILDFTNDITSITSTSSITNYGEAAEALAEHISVILHSNNSLDEEKKKLQLEVKKYFQEINIDHNVDADDQARELVEKLQNLTPKTSTPRRYIDKGLSFRPRRNSHDSTLSAILSDKHIEQHKRQTAPNDAEEQYTFKLVGKIDHWIQNLEIDINSKDQKAFKDIMVQDLASDIVDRQKYLQLNPNVKTSDEDELEHLNYQVFRWLNKLPHIKRILPPLSKTKELLDLIKTVTVPQLLKQKIINDTSNNFASTSSKQTGHLKSLHKEIFTFMESIPSDQYVSLDRHFQHEIIQKIMKDINELQNNETLTESALNNIIFEWLQKLIYDQSSIQNLSEGLKAVLINKHLIVLSPDNEVARENSRILQEDIRSMILDWLKEKSFYQKRSSAEKRFQEQTVVELSKVLKDTIQDENFAADSFRKDADLLEKIKSHIKKMPMEVYLKNDMEFLNSMAIELLNCLKNLEHFQNLTINYSQHINDMLVSEIEEWMKTLPISTQINSLDRRRLDKIKEEIKEKLKSIKTQLPSRQEFDENFRTLIKRCLLQMPLELKKKQDEAFLEQKIKDLEEILHQSEEKEMIRNHFISDSAIKDILHSWSQKLPFQEGKTVKDIMRDIDNFVLTLRILLQSSEFDDSTQKKKILEEKISSFAKSLPLQWKKLTKENVSDLVNKLLSFTNSMPEASASTDSNTTSVYKNPTDILYDELMNWCDDLHIQEENVQNGQSRNKILKQYIVSKLINKIVDLNMHPDIFNDDSLYEDLLKDEIDEIFSTLQIKDKSEIKLNALKNEFLDKVKKVKEKTQHELAGHAYKQQLRDAISQTLPSIKNITEEQKIPFEILKDNLAEAFINLYYTADSVELKNKWKQQITNEINKFCNEYLKRFPATPMDPKQLNQQLYTVLQKVPVPKNDTIRTEVEKIKIKDEINGCFKILALDPSEELQNRKIISILAKELHDIKKEKVSVPTNYIEDQLKQSILKWIRKLHVTRGTEFEFEKVADKLVNKLIVTEDNYKNNITDSHVSQNAQSRTKLSNITSEDNLKQYSLSSRDPLKQYSAPKSTLSSADKEHFKNIRQRVSSSIANQNTQKNDASLSPKSVEASNQTDIGPRTIQHLHSQPEQNNNFLPYYQSTNQPISPNVIVNEYNWENTDLTTTPRTIHDGQESQTPNTHNQSYASSNQPQLPLKKQLQPKPYFPTDQNIQDLGYNNTNPLSTTKNIEGQPYSLPNQSPYRSIPSNTSTQSPLQSQGYNNTNQLQSPMTSKDFQRNNYTLPNQFPYGRVLQDSPTQSPFIIRQPPYSPLHPPQTTSQSNYINQPLDIDQTTALETPQVSCSESPPLTSPSSVPQIRLDSQLPHGTSRDTRSGSPPTTRGQSGNRSPDISSSSPYEHYYGQKKTYKDAPRVTKLGSFDDSNRCSQCCGKQSSKAEQRLIAEQSPDEDSEWTIRFPEDTDFWGTPSPRRRPRSRKISEPRNGQLIKERKEEKTRCHCRERILTKCVNKRPKSCNHSPYYGNESIHHCPKCCGMRCPHPSYLYFK